MIKTRFIYVFLVGALCGCDSINSQTLTYPSESKTVSGTKLAVQKVTDKNFAGFTQSGIVVVDYWAPWCGPCIKMKPVYEKVAQEFAGAAQFGALNVDENPKTSEKFNIRSIPTFIIYKNGKEVDRVIGGLSSEALAERIKNNI